MPGSDSLVTVLLRDRPLPVNVLGDPARMVAVPSLGRRSFLLAAPAPLDDQDYEDAQLLMRSFRSATPPAQSGHAHPATSTHKHHEEDSQPDEDTEQGEPYIPREDIALIADARSRRLLLLLH